MKRILWLGSFTLSFLLLQPVFARAAGYGVPADCAHGFGWLKAKCLNRAPWIHQHGPLYNYGPYCPWGPGYNQLEIPLHQLGYYVPAYPAAYYGYGYGQGGYGHPVPQAQVAPKQAPAPAVPASPAHSPRPITQAPQQTEVTPVSFETFYPIYLQQVWPSRE
jgi:hypothetical protein